jgi:hypothetical protein
VCSSQRVNDYIIYSCSSSGSLSFAGSIAARVLLVGGGGGGGRGGSPCGEGGGGGGAGQYLEVFPVNFNGGAQYTFTIGAGVLLANAAILLQSLALVVPTALLGVEMEPLLGIPEAMEVQAEVEMDVV